MSNQPALQHTAPYLPHPADYLQEKPRRGFWKTVLRIIAWGMYVLSVPVCLVVMGVVIVGLVLLGGSIDNVVLHFVVMLVMPFVALVLGCVGLYFFGVKIIGGLFTYSRADSEVEDGDWRFDSEKSELTTNILMDESDDPSQRFTIGKSKLTEWGFKL